MIMRRKRWAVQVSTSLKKKCHTHWLTAVCDTHAFPIILMNVWMKSEVVGLVIASKCNFHVKYT